MTRTSENFDGIKSELLFADRELVFLVRPTIPDLELAPWLTEHRPHVDAWLARGGAILFRGFKHHGAASFFECLKAAFGDLLEYTERSSPRTEVGDRIYTSTDHPADQAIFVHNEQSYNLTFPRIISFFCVLPSSEGGETPLTNCRRVYQRLSAGVRQRFQQEKYQYVRNYHDKIGLNWQSVFQTSNRDHVEAYCKANQIALEWVDGKRLRTRQIRTVAGRHPDSNEMTWTNHVTFFHVSTLPAGVQKSLARLFGQADLPNNTYYGDGTSIEEAVLEELRAAYREETVAFRWEEGDLLFVDNMITAHGRNPYAGPRKILTGMARPHAWSKVTLT